MLFPYAKIQSICHFPRQAKKRFFAFPEERPENALKFFRQRPIGMMTV
jgi:hypothetical protein